MSHIGIIKSTGKKIYLTGPYYNNPNGYWRAAVKPFNWFKEDEIKGMPYIRRKEFLTELHDLLQRYNASIEVSYEETCVSGDPMETTIVVDSFPVLNIEGGSFDADSIDIDNI